MFCILSVWGTKSTCSIGASKQAMFFLGQANERVSQILIKGARDSLLEYWFVPWHFQWSTWRTPTEAIHKCEAAEFYVQSWVLLANIYPDFAVLLQHVDILSNSQVIFFFLFLPWLLISSRPQIPASVQYNFWVQSDIKTDIAHLPNWSPLKNPHCLAYGPPFCTSKAVDSPLLIPHHDPCGGCTRHPLSLLLPTTYLSAVTLLPALLRR